VGIIALTGWGQEQDRRRALELEFEHMAGYRYVEVRGCVRSRSGAMRSRCADAMA